MSFDRYRVAKAIQSARKIDIVALSPHQTDQARQADVRKLITETTRQSSSRTVLLIAVEI